MCPGPCWHPWHHVQLQAVCLAGTPTATPAWQEGTRCWSNRDCGGGETCCGGRCAGLCSAEHQGGTRRAAESREPWGSSPQPPCPLAEGSGASPRFPTGGDAAALPGAEPCCGAQCPWACGAKGAAWGRLDCGLHSHPGGTTATQHHVLQGKPASARPALGCSPAMTAEPGASTMPSAPARRSAACTAVTMSACLHPEVRATQSHSGQGREGAGRGVPLSSGSCGSGQGRPAVIPHIPSPTASCPPEKPGICPLAEGTLTTAAPCGTACTGDWQCPGAEKCCRSRCGHACSAPEQGEGTVTGMEVPHTVGHTGKPPAGLDVGQCCLRAGTQTLWGAAVRVPQGSR